MKENLKEMTLEEYVKESSVSIYKLLGYEKSIEIKKEYKIKLTKEEKLFDDLVLKPSKMYAVMIRILEDNKNKGVKNENF